MALPTAPAPSSPPGVADLMEVMSWVGWLGSAIGIGAVVFGLAHVVVAHARGAAGSGPATFFVMGGTVFATGNAFLAMLLSDSIPDLSGIPWDVIGGIAGWSLVAAAVLGLLSAIVWLLIMVTSDLRQHLATRIQHKAEAYKLAHQPVDLTKELQTVREKLAHDDDKAWLDSVAAMVTEPEPPQ